MQAERGGEEDSTAQGGSGAVSIDGGALTHPLAARLTAEERQPPAHAATLAAARSKGWPPPLLPCAWRCCACCALAAAQRGLPRRCASSSVRETSKADSQWQFPATKRFSPGSCRLPERKRYQACVLRFAVSIQAAMLRLVRSIHSTSMAMTVPKIWWVEKKRKFLLLCPLTCTDTAPFDWENSDAVKIKISPFAERRVQPFWQRLLRPAQTAADPPPRHAAWRSGATLPAPTATLVRASWSGCRLSTAACFSALG